MGVVWAECAVRLSRLGHYIVHMHGVRGSLCLKGFGWLKSTEILALKYVYVHYTCTCMYMYPLRLGTTCLCMYMNMCNCFWAGTVQYMHVYTCNYVFPSVWDSILSIYTNNMHVCYHQYMYVCNSKCCTYGDLVFIIHYRYMHYEQV